MIRAMFGRAECETGNKHPGLHDMGPWTWWALIFTTLMVCWGAFKYFESEYFPVVEKFEITRAVARDNETMVIYGRFDKVRQCEYVELVAYSGAMFVTVRFVDSHGHEYPTVTRRVRTQTFGPWVLNPKTAQLELYVTHSCLTGKVVTELFKGALVHHEDK